MLCKFCHENKKLIEADIIPRCLLFPIFDTSLPLIRLSKNPDVHTVQVHTGEYDPGILCADCDNYFSPWENYAADLLMRSNAIYKRTQEAGLQGQQSFVIGPYDYSRLKLCFLSILWKMSISNRPPFRTVKLGTFESKIREMLVARNPGEAGAFPISIHRLYDYVGSSSMIGARLEPQNGLDTYLIGLPGYVIAIKVDERPLLLPFTNAVLQPDRPLVIGLQHLPLEPHLLHMAGLHQERAARNKIRRHKSKPTST
jgi:hypothetical protein